METYGSMHQYISSVQSAFGTSLELHSQTELFLHHYCKLIRDHVAVQFGDHGEPLTPTTLIGEHPLLPPFRTWALICETEPGHGVGSRNLSPGISPRRGVWRAYYDILTMLLHYRSKGASRSASYIAPNEDLSDAALGTEIRRVERVYEALLLGEVSFPKANDANPEVETWTDQVMTNWAIQCAPTWKEEDLESGGRSATSKRVLAVSRFVPSHLH